VFDAAEVAAVAEVAERHDLLVITDEIWGDLIQPGFVHRPLALSDDRFSGRLITLGSASKTFNLAGKRTITARFDQLAQRLARDVPSMRCDPPDATYLGWLDFRSAGLGDDPAAVLLDRFGVALSSGPMFGPNSAGFARINVATSEQLLDLIIDRIAEAVDDHRERS
jgi:cystathionine beta-lyase